MAERVDIGIDVSIEDAVAKLMELPGVTEKQARGMAKAIQKHVKKAEKEVEKASTEMREALGDAMEGAKQAAEGLGGSFGALAGTIEKFARAGALAGTSLGPVALGAGAAALAITGMGAAAVAGGVALVGLLDEAEATLNALDPFQNALQIPPEDIATLREADAALDAIKTAASAAGLTLAAEFAEPVKDAAIQVGALVLKIREMVDGLADSRVAQAMGAWAHFWTSADTAVGRWNPLAAAVRGVTAAVEEQVPAMLELVETHEKVNAKVRDGGKALKAYEEAAKELNDTLRDERKLFDDLGKANEALVDIVNEANSDQLTDIQRINAAYEDRIEKIREAGKASSDAASVTVALAAAEERRVRDLDEHWSTWQTNMGEGLGKMEESLQGMQDGLAAYIIGGLSGMMDYVQTVTGNVTGAIETLSDLRIEALQEEAAEEQRQAEREWARQERTLRQETDMALERGEISQAQHAARMKQINLQARAERKRIRGLAKDEKREAMKSHKRNQAARIAAAVIDGAAAALKLVGAYWYLGPGAPAAAAGTAALATGAQIAAIKAADPPSFASGGMVGDRVGPDHFPIMAAKSEGIVSPRGMAALGREGLDAINRGMGAMSTSVSVVLDRRVIAHAVVDALSGGPAGSVLSARTGIPSGRALVYGRG